MFHFEKIFLVTLIVLSVGMVTAIIAYAPVEAKTSAKCLAKGYPDFKVDYAFNGFCIKRVNQTDVVEAL